MSSVAFLREQLKLLEQQDALQRQIVEQKAILDEQEDARKAPLDARSKGFKASQRATSGPPHIGFFDPKRGGNGYARPFTTFAWLTTVS